MTESLESAMRTLRRYAYARNRNVDHVPREVSITDDEAVAILEALVEAAPERAWPR